MPSRAATRVGLPGGFSPRRPPLPWRRLPKRHLMRHCPCLPIPFHARCCCTNKTPDDDHMHRRALRGLPEDLSKRECTDPPSWHPRFGLFRWLDHGCQIPCPRGRSRRATSAAEAAETSALSDRPLLSRARHGAGAPFSPRLGGSPRQARRADQAAIWHRSISPSLTAPTRGTSRPLGQGRHSSSLYARRRQSSQPGPVWTPASSLRAWCPSRWTSTSPCPILCKSPRASTSSAWRTTQRCRPGNTRSKCCSSLDGSPAV
jgi:hypothetical protein